MCQVRRIPRPVGTLLLISFNWISVFGEISSHSPYLPNSSNSPFCWYPSLKLIQLNFSLWRNIIRLAIFAKIRRIRRPVDTLLLNLFNWILVFSEISSHSPSLPSSSNSLNSLLCWYPSLELIQLNFSLAKYRHICHICQVRRIRWSHRSVGTLLLSLFNYISVFGEISSLIRHLWKIRRIPWIRRYVDTLLLSLFNWISVCGQISTDLQYLRNFSNSPPGWYPSPELIQLNFSLWPNIIRLAIFAKIRRIPRPVGTLLLSSFNWIPVFGEISSHSPYLPNSLNSLNWPLCWHPSIELIQLNFSLWRNIVTLIRHLCQIRRIRWYPSLELVQLNFSVWPNIVTFAIFAKFVEFVEFAAPLTPFSWAYSTEFQSLAKYHQICHICQFRPMRCPVGSLLLSLFNWISVFVGISSHSP